jgi:hypothetical protein
VSAEIAAARYGVSVAMLTFRQNVLKLARRLPVTRAAVKRH